MLLLLLMGHECERGNDLREDQPERGKRKGY
jgi:hypothetical protein